MANPIHNPDPEQWPKIFTIKFQDPSKFGKEATTLFMVGQTWGAEKERSKVHSVRPKMVGGVLTFYVYFHIEGSEEEVLWQVFSGLPYWIMFDTKMTLTGGYIE